MAREDGHIVAERKDFISDAAQEQIVIAAGKIAASDASGEKNVAAEENALAVSEKAEAARTMAGNQKNLKVDPADFLQSGFFEQKIGAARLDLELKSVALENFRIGEKRDAVLVAANFRGMIALDFRGVDRVIEMPVRDEQRPHAATALREPFGNALRSVDEEIPVISFHKKCVRIEQPAAVCVYFHDSWQVSIKGAEGASVFSFFAVGGKESHIASISGSSFAFCGLPARLSNLLNPLNMKLTRILLWPLAALLMTSVSGIAADSDPDYGQIEIAVGKLLEQGHYTRQKLDSDVSDRFLNNYLDALDYNHLFFTQQDVDAFTQKYGAILGDDVLLGNPTPADQIFRAYRQRVKDRVAKIEQLLKTTKFVFTSDQTVDLNRTKTPWPANAAAADALWKKRIEGEVLQETLFQANHAKKNAKFKKTSSANGEPNSKSNDKKTEAKPDAKADSAKSSAKPLADKTAVSDSGKAAKGKTSVPSKTPVQVVAHRYEQVLKNLNEMTRSDEMTVFLNALAQTYDPHSNYFSKDEDEQFNIDMKLSLVGIGAQLQSDNGYVKITDILPGGPAQIDGRLKIGDLITGVAQGDKDFVDITDMRLQKVVDMIRGKKATVVRLQVIPAHAIDPSARKVITLTRNVVKIRAQEAHAQLIERRGANGHTRRIGWITLPGFYANLDGEGPPKSCTADVAKLLTKLESEHIDGLVIDLRLDGGGSLSEAINLAGLFIGSGPVVQTKDANGNVKVSDADLLAKPAYSGPMIVLTNKLSASASEIFAGAMQDYKRAVIVGSNSFGKGTVQTIADIARWVPFLGSDPSQAGSLKLTIQKFYRISGQSTQLRGVIPDIKLPSIFDRPDLFGESALKGPLPYDQVAAAQHKIWNEDYDVTRLRERSAKRVARDVEFRWISEDLKRNEEKAKLNQLSLNEKKREQELAVEKKRETERKAILAGIKQSQEKVFDITLENLNQPQLQLAKYNDKNSASLDALSEESESEELGGSDSTNGKPPLDPIKDETLNIMDDIIHFETPAPKIADKTSHQ